MALHTCSESWFNIYELKNIESGFSDKSHTVFSFPLQENTDHSMLYFGYKLKQWGPLGADLWISCNSQSLWSSPHTEPMTIYSLQFTPFNSVCNDQMFLHIPRLELQDILFVPCYKKSLNNIIKIQNKWPHGHEWVLSSTPGIMDFSPNSQTDLWMSFLCVL